MLKQNSDRHFFGRLNLYGTVIESLILSEKYAFWQTGQEFYTAFQQNDREKALNFWAQVMEKGRAVHWSLYTIFGEKSEIIYLDALRYQDDVFLAGARSLQGLLNVYRFLLDETLDSQSLQAIIIPMVINSLEAGVSNQLNEEFLCLNNELINTQRELAKKNQQLEEISQAKSAFLANINHEIRTPLTAMLAFTDELLKLTPSPYGLMGLNYLQEIKGSGLQLLQLVNDLLDLSKAEANKIALILTEVKIDDIARLVVKNLSSLARQKQIEINLEAEELPEVIADQDRVRQVMTNLLGNALKFSEPGSMVTIRLQSSYPPDEGVIVTVSDHGPGIPDYEQANIFEPFYRIEHPSDRSVPGSGLGLALVKRIIDLHHGWITVNSALGKGTSFQVFWPSYPAFDPDLEE
jgi:signal transduction histidine kinase